MKFTYQNGDAVPRGAYWNVSTGELVHCDATGDVLPGERVTYLRIHPAALLLLGPILGLAYALFLPFIGLALVAQVIIGKVLTSLGTHLAREAGFRWRPSEAYLTGKPSARKRR